MADQELKKLIKQIDEQPDNYNYIHELYVYLIEHNSAEQAVQLISKFLTLHDISEARYDLGVALYQQGDYEKAIETFKNVNDEKLTAELNYMLASSYFALKEFKKSLAYILLNSEDSVNDQKLLALDYFNLQLVDSAKEVWQKIVANNPDDFESNLYLGIIHLDDLGPQNVFLQKAEQIDSSKFSKAAEKFSGIANYLNKRE